VDTGVRKHEELRRVIGIWDAAVLVVGLIIGSGIFRAPASVAQELPTPALMLAAWVIGGLLSLAGGLAAAELGVRYPQSGGQYVFLREAFGPSTSFAFGWSNVIISKPSVLAGIATVFATYVYPMIGAPAPRRVLAMGAVALFTLINCWA
jgi:APA family basic amino acid/polyamine antiporter